MPTTPASVPKTPSRRKKTVQGAVAPEKPRAAKAAKGVVLRISGEPGMAVFVAGSFNNWDPAAIPLVETRKGSYRVSLDLAPGIYEYKFVVNGAWTLDPDPKRDWTQNSFGTLNSLLRVE